MRGKYTREQIEDAIRRAIEARPGSTFAVVNHDELMRIIADIEVPTGRSIGIVYGTDAPPDGVMVGWKPGWHTRHSRDTRWFVPIIPPPPPPVVVRDTPVYTYDEEVGF